MMLVPIEKPVSKFQFGVYGSRHAIISEFLKKKKLNFSIIENIKTLKKSFDIIFGSGIYQRLPEAALRNPIYGFVLFHETPLPEGRGWAPLHWTVAHHRPHLTITAFRAISEMDSGDIVYSVNIPITETDTLPILNKKRESGIGLCLEEILKEMEQGYIVIRPQSGQISISSKRTPKDSELDASQPLIKLWNQIRICDNEKFPAFFRLGDKKIILRYDVAND